MNLSTLATYSTSSPLVDYSEDVPLHRLLDKDIYVMPMRLGTNAMQYNAPNTSLTTATTETYGWQTVIISFDGAVASAVGVIEIAAYYNYEFVFDESNSITAFAQPPPPNNPLVRTVVSKVAPSVGNVFSGVMQQLEDAFVSKAAKVVSSYVAGPAGTLLALLDA